MGRPVVAPVMDGEILYLGTPASGGMLVLDRIAAGDLRLAGVGIGFAQPVEENMTLCRLPSLLPDRRSEEHTSELQSLMRISYAVHCLKKNIQRYDILGVYSTIRDPTK